MDAFDQALADHRAGRLAAAATGYRRVLDADPDHADACHLLGLTLHQRGENRLAAELIRHALLMRPLVSNYHNSLGLALRGLGDADGALDAFQAAVARDPANAEAYNNIGTVYCDRRRFAEAEQPLRRALALRPDYAAAQNNLGRVLVWAGAYDEAVDLLRRACAAEGGNANYWNSLGVALREAGDIAGALAAVEAALQREPQLIDAHVNRAHLWLLTGKAEQGWAEHEWRLRRPRFAARMAERRWTGAEVDGRTVLLWAEQGIGDAIQFIRYAPMVAARGARVVVECPELLVRLFATVDGVSATVRPGETDAYDAHAALMSLPHILRVGYENRNYLVVPDAMPLEDEWTCRVGLVWAGNPGHANDRNRSHALAEFAPLALCPGVEFYSLQVGPDADAPAPDGMALRRLGLCFGDFADTAAAIAALDLVIAVDTSVAHLSGAMGRETWLILPPNPDWRWGLTRESTPWYPATRLFRRERNEDRSAVFARMAGALRRWRDASRK